MTVITQNVDNLHRRAGSTVVHELHGNIERNYCTGCGKFYADPELYLAVVAVPRCPRCGGMIRPDVVWFGEMLPEQEWNAGVDAARWSDVFFCVGTSGIVYPAASLPSVARQAGAMTVEVPEQWIPDFCRHALVQEMITRVGDHPRYGVVDRHYGAPEHDGFQDILNSSVNGFLERGLFEIARGASRIDKASMIIISVSKETRYRKIIVAAIHRKNLVVLL